VAFASGTRAFIPPRAFARCMTQERWDYGKPAAEHISIEDFTKVDVRVGRIAALEAFPEARKPSYKATVDFGALGTRRTSIAVAAWYAPEAMQDRLVAAVVNFPPRRIAGFESEVLCLGAVQADGRVRLLRPEDGSELGSRVF